MFYSGTLQKGTRLLNPRTGKYERIGRLVRMHANKREAVESIPAGDIAAVMGLKNTVTGDTLCDEDHPIMLVKMSFPESVIAMSIEPKDGKDRDKLTDTIGRMMREDPTFRAQTDEATGQLIISGMGELHLEVVRQPHPDRVQGRRPEPASRRSRSSSASPRPVETEARYVRQSGGRGQ